MTTEQKPVVPTFTGQEDVYCVKIDKYFDPSDTLRVLFEYCRKPIPDDAGRIAKVLVERKGLSLLAPLFPDPGEDIAASESRLAGKLAEFITSEKTKGNLLVGNNALEVKREEHDSTKPDLAGHSQWTFKTMNLLSKANLPAMRHQVAQIEQALLS